MNLITVLFYFWDWIPFHYKHPKGVQCHYFNTTLKRFCNHISHELNLAIVVYIFHMTGHTRYNSGRTLQSVEHGCWMYLCRQSSIDGSRVFNSTPSTLSQCSRGTSNWHPNIINLLENHCTFATFASISRHFNQYCNTGFTVINCFNVSNALCCCIHNKLIIIKLGMNLPT